MTKVEEEEVWKGRLRNWKFTRAFETMPEGHQWRDHVRALSESYGNSGWFEGHQGTIVACAVAYILGEDADE